MAPEEMESLVTFPIESAINGASGVRRVRSATAVGIAVVWVEFDWGTDIFMARQLVSEKLSLVGGTLAAAGRAPGCSRRCRRSWARFCSSPSPSDTDDPLTLRTIADTTVRRRLLAVPGVSQVTPIGGAERQFQVIAHPDALRANNVYAHRAARRPCGRQPEHVGRRRTPRARRSTSSKRSAASRTPEEIGETVVALARRSVRARAQRRRRPGGRRVQARRRLAQRQAGGDRRRAEAARRQHDRGHRAGSIASSTRSSSELPRGMTIDRRIFRQADFIEVAVDERRSARFATAACSSSSSSSCFLANTAGERHHADGDSAVARGGRPGAARIRRRHQHDDARRHGDRGRRSGRRCDRRCRERGAAASGESREAGSGAAARRRPSFAKPRSRSDRRSCSRPSSSSWCFCPLFGLAGVEGRLLDAAGVRLHRGAAGVARGRGRS